jgi:hypothetical protein
MKFSPLNFRQNKINHCFTVLVFFATFYMVWFLPSLLEGELLAPGDGYIQSIPAYYSPRTLWTDQLLGGFPVASDVTPQTWYLPSLLLSLIPNSWNAFVISSYVLASTFSYAYVYVITQSRLAGLVSGIIYGASGFMMSRLGHTSIIHSATWIPLCLMACEQLFRSNRNSFVALLSISIACLFLAGHPQISIYGLGLTTIYAILTGGFYPHRFSLYGKFIIATIIGLGLSAIQLVPTIELAGLTPRSSMSFQDFVSYSIPLDHIITAFFPNIFGGAAIPPYDLPFIGIIQHADIPIHIGLLSLVLMVLGARTRAYEKSFRYFWVSVAVISFLLTLGPSTPLAWITYQIPVYNKFRILSRHSVELAMSVSVLAGLGISAVQQRLVNERYLKRLILSSSVFMALMTLVALVTGVLFLSKNKLDNPSQLIPYLSIAILPSLIIFILGLLSLFNYTHKKNLNRSTKTSAACLLIVLTVDMALSGWFSTWQVSPVATEVLEKPAFLQKYQNSMELSHQRFFPINGSTSNLGEVPPNLSRIWKSPSISGYGPLLLSRVKDFLSITPSGSLSDMNLVFEERNLSLDLAAVRYITTSTKFIPPSLISDRTKWASGDLPVLLGSSCLPDSRSEVTIKIPEIVSIDSISLVGYLGCSTPLTQGTDILEINTYDRDGLVQSHIIKVGQDFSEYSLECPFSSSQTKHQRSKLFNQLPFPGQDCPFNVYTTKVILRHPVSIDKLQFRFLEKNVGWVALKKITLNNSKYKNSYPLIGSRWKYVEDIGDTRIYENLNVMPRAWLTSNVQIAQPSQILNAIKTSQLPDGEMFDHTDTALLEEPINFSPQTSDPNATVQVEFPTETQVRVHTRSAKPSFLVLSDVFYPGWKAHIDGKPTRVYQTDYIFRGVQLPPGEHTVSFSFRPQSFTIGCGITGISLGLLLFIVVTGHYRHNLSTYPRNHESV